jgi:hypothetical protein
VDTFFDRVEDDLTSDDWQAIREGKEDAAQGTAINLKEYLYQSLILIPKNY